MFGGRDYGEYSGISLVEIVQIFATHGTLFFGTSHLTQYILMHSCLIYYGPAGTAGAL